MAIYNPVTPPMFLSGTAVTVTGKELYSYVDETKISFTGAYITYNISVEQISGSAHFPMIDNPNELARLLTE
mgnify:CR=1 FL=1